MKIFKLIKRPIVFSVVNTILALLDMSAEVENKFRLCKETLCDQQKTQTFRQRTSYNIHTKIVVRGIMK